jgi:hypothetical protein
MVGIGPGRLYRTFRRRFRRSDFGDRAPAGDVTADK